MSVGSCLWATTEAQRRSCAVRIDRSVDSFRRSQNGGTN